LEEPTVRRPDTIIMSKAIIYTRVSTKEQDTDNQLHRIREELTPPDDAEVVREHHSAYGESYEKRPKFSEVKQSIEEGDVDHLYVYALDRLGRDWKKQQSFIELLRENGVVLHSYREDFLKEVEKIPEQFRRGFRHLILDALLYKNQRESEDISERVKAAYENHEGDWGRPSIRDRIRDDVLRLWDEGKNKSEIARTVTYYDDNRNKKSPSRATVHKIIDEHRE